MATFDGKPNGVAQLRKYKEDVRKMSTLEIGALRGGFASDFWKLIEQHLNMTLKACRDELEASTSHERNLQLQGEIAAIKVLLDLKTSTEIPKTN